MHINLRLFLFSAGYHRLKYVDLDVDYSHYLGPDYDRTLKEGNTLIANHSEWTDVGFFMQSKWWPAFLSKLDVKKKVGFGIVAQCIRCIFIDRDSDKSREETVEAIL